MIEMFYEKVFFLNQPPLKLLKVVLIHNFQPMYCSRMQRSFGFIIFNPFIFSRLQRRFALKYEDVAGCDSKYKTIVYCARVSNQLWLPRAVFSTNKKWTLKPRWQPVMGTLTQKSMTLRKLEQNFLTLSAVCTHTRQAILKRTI